MAKQHGLSAGQAARAAGLSRKAMRIYEEKGLVVPAARTSSGYRLYSDDDLAALRFIRCAKMLGLRLDDVAAVIDARDRGETFCTLVKSLLDERLREIDEALGELGDVRRQIVAAVDQCGGSDAAADECPIYIDAAASRAEERCT